MSPVRNQDRKGHIFQYCGPVFLGGTYDVIVVIWYLQNTIYMLEFDIRHEHSDYILFFHH